MDKTIKKRLIEASEEGYQVFSKNLTPGAKNILGIRVPVLRSMAKEMSKANWKEVLSDEEDEYFEETMLRGMIISYGAKTMDEALPYLEDFIPRVDNWAVCDSVFMGMKVLQKDRDRTMAWIQPYFNSKKEFSVRVAILIMMQHLLKCDEKGKSISRKKSVTMEDLMNQNEVGGKYIEAILEGLNREFDEGYYASMAASWLMAECLCIFPNHTLRFLQGELKMNKETFNKGIQKSCESRIPDDEVKEYLRGMKSNHN